MSGVTAPPLKSGSRPRHYRCHHRARNGAEACSNKKQHRAEKIEAEVWEEVLRLLKDPERLRTGIARMIEDGRKALRVEPAQESGHWHKELQKIERMRDGYLDQQTEGIISMSELKGKLATLDERRAVAARELEKLTRHRERIAKLEQQLDELLERYRFKASEGLDLYTPEDKRDAYRALGIKVIACPDGSKKLTGSVLVGVYNDVVRSKPAERSHAPLSTGASRPLFTVIPPPESL